MLIKKYKILSLLALVALGYGCEQSAPANLYEETGDLYFSGYYFNYKIRAFRQHDIPAQEEGSVPNQYHLFI